MWGSFIQKEINPVGGLVFVLEGVVGFWLFWFFMNAVSCVGSCRFLIVLGVGLG
jgi:hypothetical protein